MLMAPPSREIVETTTPTISSTSPGFPAFLTSTETSTFRDKHPELIVNTNTAAYDPFTLKPSMIPLSRTNKKEAWKPRERHFPPNFSDSPPPPAREIQNRLPPTRPPVTNQMSNPTTLTPDDDAYYIPSTFDLNNPPPYHREKDSSYYFYNYYEDEPDAVPEEILSQRMDYYGFQPPPPHLSNKAMVDRILPAPPPRRVIRPVLPPPPIRHKPMSVATKLRNTFAAMSRPPKRRGTNTLASTTTSSNIGPLTQFNPFASLLNPPAELTQHLQKANVMNTIQCVFKKMLLGANATCEGIAEMDNKDGAISSSNEENIQLLQTVNTGMNSLQQLLTEKPKRHKVSHDNMILEVNVIPPPGE